MPNLLFGLVGLLVGGVINVLADELPHRERPQRPRCIQCRYEYAPTRWLALGRRLWGGGRCPQCGLRVRVRAVTVELGTTLIFALLPSVMEEPANLFFTAIYLAILILVIVTDLEHRLILHVVTFPGLLLALIGSFFLTANSLVLALAGAAIGFGVFFAFFLIGKTLFGPGAMGFGDVTLATMMGAMLGFPYIVFALVGAVLLAGLISFVLIALGRLSLRSYVAYGPYLAVAGILVILWGDSLLSWYLS